MALRLLLIDDDARLHELLGSYLAQHEVTLEHAPDGPRGLARLEAEVFDAVLLDVMLPGMNGLDVCRRIRARGNIPILMLTARGDEADRVAGLELGADDYIPKPFSPRELLARVRAVLRRTHPDAVAERLSAGPITVDTSIREVRVEGRVVELTALEFDVLLALARRAGRVIPRESLLSEAGRSGTVVSERAVDVHISHLRQKLGDDPREPRLIKTVRGVGYVLSRGPG